MLKKLKIHCIVHPGSLLFSCLRPAVMLAVYRSAHFPDTPAHAALMGPTISSEQLSQKIRDFLDLSGPGKSFFWSLLGVCCPGDPENRVRGAILHILVVGELRAPGDDI